MPFSTKATLVNFVGDIENYPCHAILKVGDTLFFDGGEIKGKTCPDMMAPLANAMFTVYMTGPRFVPPANYNLFWYSCNSKLDPSKKAYDGYGWDPINYKFETPPYHVACLQDPKAFQWPPSEAYSAIKDYTLMCPDTRSGALFKIDAFDLAWGGHALPYSRRQIVIMDRVAKTGGAWPVQKIMDLYSEFEVNEIYPPLSDAIIEMMIEELRLLDWATIENGEITVTQKGIDRVARFKDEIPAEDVKALNL